MTELYRWVFLMPLLVAVLSTIQGRPRPFRVTPKVVPCGLAAPAFWLVMPLLIMLGLQLLNLVLLLRGPNPILPRVWSVLAVVSLLAAVRACWDRHSSDAVIWFQPEPVDVVLEQGGSSWSARITAISEQGVELSWPAAAPEDPGLAQDQPVTIHADCLGPDPLTLQPRQLRAAGRTVRLGGDWRWRCARDGSALQDRLYQQPGCWPVRQAPRDRLALPALVWHVLQPQRPEGWFARSALPIRLDGRPPQSTQ